MSPKYLVAFIFSFMVLLLGCETVKDNEKNTYKSWKSYLGDPARSHFTELSQIDASNVHQLKPVWRYMAPDSGQMQMNPIVVDTILYGVTAALRAVAINAKNGEEIWRFGDSLKVWHSTSRGVSYWSQKDDRRIFFTHGANLYALNALTGNPIETFGNMGSIDLRKALGNEGEDKFVVSNTPGTIFKELVIMPLRVSEDVGAAPGSIVAYNVKSGQPVWVFETIPKKGAPGSETWNNTDIQKKPIGGANNWAGMTLDTETEILYVPTGSASPDFYGGERKGANLFANCLLAINANNGELLWYFQFTHHDLWDRDLPAPPNLLTVIHNGKKIKAIAQVTKQGYVYLFNRATGEPLFDVIEKKVPNTSLVGESSWPTQPFPVKPKPFSRQSSELTESDVSPYAPNKDSLAAVIKKADKTIYAPPATQPVLLLPGYDGGAEWGGAGVDPENGILYVNANEMAWILQMEETRQNYDELPLGEKTYMNLCSSCHQKDRKGLPNSGFPSLITIEEHLSRHEINEIIAKGRGMMTGFPALGVEEKNALLDYLLNIESAQLISKPQKDNTVLTPYKHMGYNKFLDQNGLPAISPPWGTLHAIDMNSGEYLWSIPFGETMSQKNQGFPTTGSENYGGPIITKNGLLFIAATKDGYFRAFDRHTGKLLWEYKLPAPAFATPSTYEINGKQYIAIACGGEKLGTPKGNQIIAFALE